MRLTELDGSLSRREESLPSLFYSMLRLSSCCFLVVGLAAMRYDSVTFV
jgi:hypothetical protein